jgi:hypothetical protein
MTNDRHRELSRAGETKLDTLSEEFDALLAKMQRRRRAAA